MENIFPTTTHTFEMDDENFFSHLRKFDDKGGDEEKSLSLSQKHRKSLQIHCTSIAFDNPIIN